MKHLVNIKNGLTINKLMIVHSAAFICDVWHSDLITWNDKFAREVVNILDEVDYSS